MRLISLLMQFERGISMSRYFPASGTAGLGRELVSGKSLVPRPPPSTRAIVFRMTNFQQESKRRHKKTSAEPPEAMGRAVPPLENTNGRVPIASRDAELFMKAPKVALLLRKRKAFSEC